MAKKILFLIHNLNGGGGQRVLVDMVNNLDFDKYDITVQTIYDNLNELKGELNPKVRYRTIVKSKNKIISFVLAYFVRRVVSLKWLYNRFVKDDYDYEIAYLEGESTRLLANSTNVRAKKYAWVHTDMMSNFGSQGLYKTIDEHTQVYKKFHKIVCVSEGVKNSFIERFGIENDVLVKYNVCDEKAIIEKSKQIVEDFEDVECIKLLTVSNLRPEKRHYLLLEVLKGLKEDGYNFKLYIIGDGPERSKIERYIDENNLCDNVKLLGKKRNPYPYMKKADLHIISSLAEGYSTVAVETAILGLPTLATDCAGMNEVFDKGKLAIIVSNDKTGIFEGIKTVLEEPEILEKHKEALKNLDKFSVESRIRKIEKLFEE